MTSRFNLPCGCTDSDISGPEPLECDVCGEQFYGDRPREIGDRVVCGECERKEANNDE